VGILIALVNPVYPGVVPGGRTRPPILAIAEEVQAATVGGSRGTVDVSAVTPDFVAEGVDFPEGNGIAST